MNFGGADVGLARVLGDVTGAFEILGEDDVVVAKSDGPAVVRALFVDGEIGVAAGEIGGARRAAEGRVGEGVGEGDAFAAERVDIRSAREAGVGLAGAMEIGRRHVDGYEDDVRARRGLTVLEHAVAGTFIYKSHARHTPCPSCSNSQRKR